MTIHPVIRQRLLVRVHIFTIISLPLPNRRFVPFARISVLLAFLPGILITFILLSWYTGYYLADTLGVLHGKIMSLRIFCRN